MKFSAGVLAVETDFFAGGHGTMWDLPQSEAVQRVTREIYEGGGIVSAGERAAPNLETIREVFRR